MDNFMDKVAQKLGAQEMIRANAAAEAAELENMEKQLTVFKEQMEKYAGNAETEFEKYRKRTGSPKPGREGRGEAGSSGRRSGSRLCFQDQGNL